MGVRDLARETVVRVAPDDSITDVAHTMEDKGVGSVIVVDDDTPVGIITDRDLAVRVLGRDGDPSEMVAGDVMSTDLVTVDGDKGVLELVRDMSNHGVRRVPVVDDGELVGIIALDDLIVLLSMELQGIANIVRSESPPYEVSATEIFGE